MSLGTLRDGHNDHKAQRQGDYGNQGQPRADRQHHDDNPDNGYDGRDQLRQALLQRCADIIHIIGCTAEDFAVGTGIKIFQRQPFQLAVHLLPHIKDNLLGDSGHYVLLHVTEQGAEQVQTAQNKQNFIHISKINVRSLYTRQHPIGAFEQLGGRLPHHFGAEDAEYSTGYSCD
ncbi:hypothetical protein D3C80_1351680 [compost metagenome]